VGGESSELLAPPRWPALGSTLAPPHPRLPTPRRDHERPRHPRRQIRSHLSLPPLGSSRRQNLLRTPPTNPSQPTCPLPAVILTALTCQPSSNFSIHSNWLLQDSRKQVVQSGLRTGWAWLRAPTWHSSSYPSSSAYPSNGPSSSSSSSSSSLPRQSQGKRARVERVIKALATALRLKK